MIKAYSETITDFQIELANTGLFEFKRRNWIARKIKYYKDLLKGLERKRNTKTTEILCCGCGRVTAVIEEGENELVISPEDDLMLKRQYDQDYLYLACRKCSRVLKAFNSVEKNKRMTFVK
jgi:hypothetical protein